MRRRGVLLVAGGLVAAGAVLGAYRFVEHRRPHDMRGSASVEFTPAQVPRPVPVRDELPWPIYGLDSQRTHFGAGSRLRPPFRKLSRHIADSSFIEFPPVIGYGRLFFGTNHGRVLAVDAHSGHVAWSREFGRCIAASPAVGNGVVYVSLMGFAPCTHPDRHAPGLLVALQARTGRILWRFGPGVTESSPLLVRGLVYIGSWDHRIYAVDVRTHRAALDVHDRRRGQGWRANAPALSTRAPTTDACTRSRHEPDVSLGGVGRSRATGRGRFYATPAVAYGRVFVGATDGIVYAFGARSGRLLWARRTGSYVYGAAAVAGRDRVRRLVRPPLLRARRGDRRGALELRRRPSDLRGSNRARRSRLFLDLRFVLGLRSGRPRPSHLRARRPDGPAGLGPFRTANTARLSRTRVVPT